MRNAIVLVPLAVALLHCTAPGTSETEEDVGDATSALGIRNGGGDPLPHPGGPRVTCYPDNDGDGFGAGRGFSASGSCLEGFSRNNTDCNDSNAGVTDGVACYADGDGDGFGGAFVSKTCGACPAHTTTTAGDCNDGAGSVHPISCYRDADGDGLAGTPATTCAATCEAAGLASTPADCNDANKGAGALLDCKGADADGDGYASHASVCASSCPSSPYEKFDCNDANASIHPEQAERAANGVDDDCNGIVDETAFTYAPNASDVTTSSMTLELVLNDAAIRSYVTSGGALWANVTYRPLANTADEHHAIVQVSTLGAGSGIVLVDGLSPATPYQVSVAFARDQAFSSQFAAPSNDYYTMTLSDSADRVAQVRPLVVLQAFHEWNDSKIGLVENGNRYCGYGCDPFHGGKNWCTEFYDSMIDQWFRDFVMRWPGIDMTFDDAVNAFQNAGAYAEVGVLYILAQAAHPGDYLAYGDDGKVHHSSMFLAYDVAKQQIWHLDGNADNRVAIGTDDTPFSHVYGVGQLTASMLR
jgi:hypothetical protein